MSLLHLFGHLAGTVVSKLASRETSHLPPCFRRIVRVLPALVMGCGAPGGVTTTVSLVHMNAQSSRILIS